MATLLLTDALADALASAVERGVPVETATQAAGISRAQFNQWLLVAERHTWPSGDPVSPDSLQRITAFAAQIRRAQATFEAKHIESIAAAAEDVNAKTGMREWRAGAWLLNNHPRYRSTYRQERITEVTQSGTIHHEHQLVRELAQSGLTALDSAEATILAEHPALNADTL